MHTRVVELDALTDPVGAGTQDDDLFPFGLRSHLGLGRRIQLVGRVVIRGLGLELGCTRVDGLVDRAHSEPVTQPLHALGTGELGTQGGDLRIGQTVVLCEAQ